MNKKALVIALILLAVAAGVKYLTFKQTYKSQDTERTQASTSTQKESAATDTGFSEGWIETIDGQMAGWAFDMGKPLHIELNFASKEEPTKKYSVSFSDSPTQTSEYLWVDRSDAGDLIREEEPQTRSLPLPKGFKYGLANFPDGHYTLLSATYNQKPFQFANSTHKEFAIKRHSIAACNPKGSTYINPIGLQTYENLELGFRIALQDDWVHSKNGSKVDFSRQYHEAGQETCTQHFTIEIGTQPLASLPTRGNSLEVTQALHVSEQLEDWQRTDWTERHLFIFSGLDKYYILNSNTYNIPFNSFVALGSNSPYSEGVMETASQGWAYDNDQDTTVQITYQNLDTKNTKVLNLAKSNHIVNNRLDIIPYLKKYGVTSYAKRPGFQISLPDSLPSGQYQLIQAIFNNKPMRLMDKAIEPFTIQ